MVKGTKIVTFKEAMPCDKNSTPDSFILLRVVETTPKVIGDGLTELFNNRCEIHLITKGVAINTTSLHNINSKKINKALKNNNYLHLNLGYDGTFTESVWEINLISGKEES